MMHSLTRLENTRLFCLRGAQQVGGSSIRKYEIGLYRLNPFLQKEVHLPQPPPILSLPLFIPILLL